MKMFDVAKIGLFLDTITHATEARQGDEVKIVTLALRVQPFDAKLALALSEDVRRSLFKLNHPDPHPHLRKVDFALGVPRQQLQVFASSDTSTASIAFDQVKVAGIYARTQKNVQGYALCFKASFGPLDRSELAYICDWHLGQRFVTFEEAEPGMFDDGAEAEEDAEPIETRPVPMFETDAEGKPIEASGDQEPVRQRGLPLRSR